MLRHTLLIIIALGSLVSCGSERSHTGVWQQVCDEDAPEPCDPAFVYALHLGRYGDQLSGLVVRHQFEDIALDPYQPTNECGCFFMSGGRAKNGMLSFTLFEPDRPRLPAPNFMPDPSCAPSPAEIPADCADRVFTLEEIDDDLQGTVSCDGQTRPIRFRRVPGRPRTACVEATP